MRVLIGIPHALLREGLRDMLNRWSGIELVGICPSVAEAVRQIPRCMPDVLLFAYSRHPADDLRALESAKTVAPNCRVMLIEEVGRSLPRDRLVDARVLPDVGVAGLVRGLRDLCAPGQHVAHPEAERAVGKPNTSEPHRILTKREFDVLCALCEGLPNKAIARRLGITDKTVKNHLSNIYRHTKTTNRTQLVLWAMEQGFATTPSAEQ